MKKRNMLFAAMLTVMLLASCVRVSVKHKGGAQEQRALAGFERIELLGPVDVRYRQADSCSVRVQASDDALERVVTQVEGKTLVVSFNDTGLLNFFNRENDNHITVYVTSPDLVALSVNGSGDFDSHYRLDTDRLDIQLRGSGDVEFDDIICDYAGVTVVGSGDVELKSIEAQTTNIEIVGSGDVKMRQRNVLTTQATVKGSGDISLRCQGCGTVNATQQGSGEIKLTGDVRRLNSQSMGSGSISTKGLTVSAR